MYPIEAIFKILVLTYLIDFVIVGGTVKASKYFRDNKKVHSFITILFSAVLSIFLLSNFEPHIVALLSKINYPVFYAQPLQIIVGIITYMTLMSIATIYFNKVIGERHILCDIGLGMLIAAVVILQEIIPNFHQFDIELVWRILAHAIALPLSVLGARKSFELKGSLSVYWTFFAASIMAFFITIIDYIPFV